MEEKQQIAPRRRSRRTLYIIAAVVAVVVIGVALGVGLGLGLNQGGGDDDGGDDGSSGSSPSSAPSPTGTVTGREFWQPAVNSSWQIVLLNPITVDAAATTASPNVDVFDIDLFTNTQDTISKLHSLGKKVICYFSAGSFEPGRPDSGNFTSDDQGKELDGWPGEKWLKLSSQNVRNIMAGRIELASNKGCDAIDPDNVDGYQNDNGLDLSRDDSIDFMKYLSDAAGKYNMSTGLKNAGDIIDDVLNVTHFSVNEQCVQYSECDTFSPFVDANKPVFHIEYPNGAPSISASDATTICASTGKADGSANFSTVMKKMNLDGWVEYCDRSTATTTTS